MVLVVLAGAGTLIAVSLMLAPTVFHRHLDQAGVLDRVERDRARGGGVRGGGTGLHRRRRPGRVGGGRCGIALVARRLTGPIARPPDAAGRLAAGDYAARVEQPRMGPELAGLADSVNALAERLEHTERSRIQLMTDLAHELRTPLASIEATVEAIADHVLPADDQTLATLTDQSRRLSRLIDDLAAVSRAEERSFRLTITTVDAVDLARAAAQAAAAGFTRGGVELHAPDGPPLNVLADPDRVGEALDQLLANSLHHCRPGDRVTIAVTRHGRSAELAVTDTGSGFDPGTSETLFQRFYRADPARANPTGSGIGLTLARALIQAQGGALTAQSPGTGAGATFTISLPTAEDN